MQDIEVHLKNEPGQLALLGETLGQSNISLEGGGVFSNGEHAIAHFLVSDGEQAKTVLAKTGIQVKAVRNVLIQKLRQDVPGQLGLFCRRLADAGVNIQVQYSDHSNQLIIVPGDYNKAKLVADAWMKEWWPKTMPAS